MNEIHLQGCTPTPLSHYLKALGILRLVATQIDGEVEGFWQDEIFVLRSRLDSRELAEFFLETYRPTPILAPWNGGSGFYPNDNQSGIAAIEQSDAIRFAPFKAFIVDMRATLDELAYEERPEGEEKAHLLTYLRSSLPDAALDWLDAAVMLAGEDPKYPPLLGTGGNDGRLDFTNNFMQRLTELFDAQTGEPIGDSDPLLAASLFGKPVPGLGSAAIGQFSPGAAGGPNATSGFEGGSLINPWDFVLMLEGSILFAAAITKKHQNIGPSVLSYPFTVRSTGSGSGAAALSDESPARAEMWLPLWNRPARCDELRNLFSEGRISLGNKPARDGLDVVRALAQLGVDRGIGSFQRYAFLMRSGKAYLATPLNRLAVRRNPASEVLDELDRGSWLSRFRRLARNKDRPGRVAELARRLEDAVFNVAQEGQQDRRRIHLQSLLVSLGAIQRYLAINPQRREECGPVPNLRADWVWQADDQSHEFRIAAALASLHSEKHRKSDSDSNHDQPTVRYLPLAVHQAPIDTAGRPVWEEGSRQVVWGEGSLDGNLFAVIQRRLVTYEQEALSDKPLAGSPLASLDAIAAFLHGEVETQRIAQLLLGLSLARPPEFLPIQASAPAPLPAAYRTLKPLFATNRLLRQAQILAADEKLPLPLALPRLLHTGRLEGPQGAFAVAQRRLTASGLPAAFSLRGAAGVNGARLLSALAIPIQQDDLIRLHHRMQPEKPVQLATDSP